MSAWTAWDVSFQLPGDFICLEKNPVKMEKNLVLRETRFQVRFRGRFDNLRPRFLLKQKLGTVDRYVPRFSRERSRKIKTETGKKSDETGEKSGETGEKLKA